MTTRAELVAESPVRVQLSRAKGWRMPPNTVKVARPCRWGNPWRVGGLRGCVRPETRMTVIGFSRDGVAVRVTVNGANAYPRTYARVFLELDAMPAEHGK